MTNKKLMMVLVLIFASGCAQNQQIATDGDYGEASLEQDKRDNVLAVETRVPMKGQLKLLDSAKKPSIEDQTDEVVETVIQKKPGKLASRQDVDVIEQPRPLAVPSDQDMDQFGKSDFLALLETVEKPSIENPTSHFKRIARVKPTSAPSGWINAITVFDFMDGALYQIYASPGHTTDIMMQPGEQIISQAAGDTFRWKVDVTSSGSGKNERQHIIIKPTHPNIETNLIITTDRRVYYAELRSQAKGAYMAGCSWSYPNDYFVTRYNTVEKVKEETNKDIAISDLSRLNFAYKLESSNADSWVPIRVFDNGRKTYIQFPKDMKYREAPVLFVLSKKGVHQIVNYRKKEDYYVVDRLFARAELREGQKDQEIVRIINENLHVSKQPIEDDRNGN